MSLKAVAGVGMRVDVKSGVVSFHVLLVYFKFHLVKAHVSFKNLYHGLLLLHDNLKSLKLCFQDLNFICAVRFNLLLDLSCLLCQLFYFGLGYLHHDLLVLERPLLVLLHSYHHLFCFFHVLIKLLDDQCVLFLLFKKGLLWCVILVNDLMKFVLTIVNFLGVMRLLLLKVENLLQASVLVGVSVFDCYQVRYDRLHVGETVFLCILLIMLALLLNC